MLSDFAGALTARIAIVELLGNLGLSVIFALILSFVIRRFSRIIGDRSQHTVVILVLMPTMVLIISVVRSSLALSLGLVGRSPSCASGPRSRSRRSSCTCSWP